MESQNNPPLSIYYLLALAYNALIIPFSKFFSPNLGNVDPIFSPSGCSVIVLVGCAYASVHKVYMYTPLTNTVFVALKTFYGVRWILWVNENHSNGTLMELLKEDIVTGLFYCIYGIGDLIYAVFFAYVAYSCWNEDASFRAMKSD
jgi:hypothetical protein